jgi:hypothetical protein
MNDHSPEIADLLIRWMRALWELVDETGSPQPMKAIGERAGMSRDETGLTCAIATFNKLQVKVEVDNPLAVGHLYEYAPRAER